MLERKKSVLGIKITLLIKKKLNEKLGINSQLYYLTETNFFNQNYNKIYI